MENCEEIYWSENENEDSFIFQSNNSTELTERLENYLEVESCNELLDVTLVKENSTNKLAHKLMFEEELILNTSGGSNSFASINVVKDYVKFEEIYNMYEEANNLFEECKEKSMNFNTVTKNLKIKKKPKKI